MSNELCFDYNRYTKAIRYIKNLLAYSIATSQCCVERIIEAKKFSEDTLDDFKEKEIIENHKNDDYKAFVDTYAYVLLVKGGGIEDEELKSRYISCSIKAFKMLAQFVKDDFDGMSNGQISLSKYNAMKSQYKILIGHYYVASFSKESVLEECSEKDYKKLMNGGFD